MMFRQHLLGTPAPSLSPEDQALVNKALGQSDNGGSTTPKVIVVKQEAPPAQEDEEENEEWDYSNMYAYPPEYYEDYYEYEDDEE